MDLIEQLKLENLQLKLAVRQEKLKNLIFILGDIQQKVPTLQDEIEVLALEIEKSRPKLEAVK